jgi:hypothetical protein
LRKILKNKPKIIYFWYYLRLRKNNTHVRLSQNLSFWESYLGFNVKSGPQAAFYKSLAQNVRF